jgi:hypothetical protein
MKKKGGRTRLRIRSISRRSSKWSRSRKIAFLMRRKIVIRKVIMKRVKKMKGGGPVILIKMVKREKAKRRRDVRSSLRL